MSIKVAVRGQMTKNKKVLDLTQKVGNIQKKSGKLKILHHVLDENS